MNGQVCPRCGERLPHSGGPGVPVGRVVSLVGGLALMAAYYMPWFSTQGIILTGSFLAQFLGSTADLRRFMPGSTGGAAEVQFLRALIYLFPGCGLAAVVLAIVATVRPTYRWPASAGSAAVGGLVLLALLIGIFRLPSGASQEVGLTLIALGALAILAGVGLDHVLGGPYPGREAGQAVPDELPPPRVQPWERGT